MKLEKKKLSKEEIKAIKEKAREAVYVDKQRIVGGERWQAKQDTQRLAWKHKRRIDNSGTQ